MAQAKRQGVLIAGGGIAASLAALAMARLRPEVPLLLVGEDNAFGGNASWTFFHDELTKDELRLVEPWISHSWHGYYVAFPGTSRKLKAECSVIRPSDLDKLVRDALGPDRFRLKARIVATREDSLILHGGEKITAEGAIDARAATNLNLLDLGWRNAMTREFVFASPHRVDRPVLMDSTLSEGASCRFTSCVPLGEKALLVEDVHYSRAPEEEDREMVSARIDSYVERRGWKGGKRKQGPVGASPIAIGGDFPAFWRAGGARVAKIGVRGGFFHPATGSPLADAIRTAMLLVKQSDFGGEHLHDLFEAQAVNAWNRREFHRNFNAALLEDRSGERCGALERLYQLDANLIARFQSERLGIFDRRRIAGAISR
ncbi:lycopene beta-cyclase CrtY [Sphingosinicella rhizophila]|uniref:Lycopene beta-cyclase CrtY n=1 Tax=Sphingosinicella rhizophila TaxID=3050082 RepID=A0ABU3Q8E5_9SPHN|nr:lycopene beta-cyclase CrtY [Sphingosinicella sp. GR2756]MDT9599685.1 lycopene beta-cyclase CrtY [Sphingosinicella sp. GR2756]